YFIVAEKFVLEMSQSGVGSFDPNEIASELTKKVPKSFMGMVPKKIMKDFSKRENSK
ncbi:MAG: hypothetical protein GKC00_03660, partial [Candidatus Methanofastidiosa archaeon]|nr:hypothetical protein [Candidatus Methanofastidiosa archaeon]